MQSVYANNDLALSSILTWYSMHSTINAWFSLAENHIKQLHKNYAATGVKSLRAGFTNVS